MSSLTPTGGARQPRSGAGVVTVAVIAVVALLAGTALGWYLGGRDTGTTATPGPSASACPTPAPLPAPAQVTVNVFNASGKTGLAKKTGTEMSDRGFAVATVGNDPKGATLDAVAEVRYGPAGERSAQLVAAQVAGTVTLTADTRTDTTVDLVLGTTYAGLAGPAEVQTKTAAAVAVPTSC